MTEQKEKFYITTAINYTNGSPHFGHAYEAVVADCLSRYHRLAGRDVFFLTGTDEHGQKVADTASAQQPPILPIQLCDKYVAEFQSLNKSLQVDYDFYVRTTQPKHEDLARLIWTLSAENDDIYLANYEGWYSKREEKFLTETEAKALNYMDGDKPLIKTSEPSYFFRQSRYQQRLIDHINTHPEFIYPSEKRTEILHRLTEPLLDLSVSRTTFDWGIPIPEDFKGQGDHNGKKHVMYVWFDALTNYLSGVDWPNGDLARYWPAHVHLIGKDIAWFHAVIWPCMLFSAGIPLPSQIICHGFVNGPDGRKMSKSWGNVVDPVQMLTKYSPDSLRYFMLREGSFGSDFSFSETSLQDRHNSELAANLGNLAARALNLAAQYCDGKIPSESATVLFDVKELSQKIEKEFSTLQIQNALQEVFFRLTDVNKWLTDQAPWHLKGDETLPQRRSIVRTLLESLYILSHFVSPFMPNATTDLFSRLGTKQTNIPGILKSAWSGLTVGSAVTAGNPLFPRIGENRVEKKAAEAAKAPDAKKAPAKAAVSTSIDVSRLDLRVGKILSVEIHPQADHLYVEQIDVGEAKPRQVCSGLAKFIPIAEMKDRLVVVVCNMKATNFRGVRSEAMVVAANSDDGTKVELVDAPANATPGTPVKADGFAGSPDEELNPKLKIFETVKPDLKSNGDRVACYKGVALKAGEFGQCTAKTLVNAQLG